MSTVGLSVLTCWLGAFTRLRAQYSSCLYLCTIHRSVFDWRVEISHVTASRHKTLKCVAEGQALLVKLMPHSSREMFDNCVCFGVSCVFNSGWLFKKTGWLQCCYPIATHGKVSHFSRRSTQFWRLYPCIPMNLNPFLNKAFCYFVTGKNLCENCTEMWRHV